MEKSEIDLAKRAQREYARQYRARNPDKIRETQRRYWLRRAQKAMYMQREGEQNERTDKG